MGEEAKEAVGKKQHEHGEQWSDRRMHSQVGAVGGTFEIAVLLGARLRSLLAQEVEVRALLRGEQLGEANESRLSCVPCDADKCLPFAKRALAACKRQCAC